MGDKLMIIMNTRINENFVCNGDFAQVVRVGGVVTRTVPLPKERLKYGGFREREPLALRFREVTLKLRNEEGELFTTDGLIIENPELRSKSTI